MAMPQQDDLIEQIRRLEANRPLGGFATHREANTPSEASAELMAYAEQQKDWDELEQLKTRLNKLLDQMA